ncbi:Hsp70 family protein [Dactylosporangium sp. AC04546]|uniref:Hsp70 family protein n=1 Tax=Dactylosporangium sp. AC04546 TaxID=2862460 RepID=UPI001EE0E647|nr:Hsp70 family protein [Dactylosporangium sp. AC04546]WVK87615.1 Hsp70 family protein [Dactylosporangium sp. AC04546]
MTDPTLVIDFGTSTSSAVLVLPDGQQRLIKEPASGSYSWPTAVCWDGTSLLVGTAAERRKRTDPAAYRREFKRDLGDAYPTPLGDRSFPVGELVTAVVTALAGRARELAAGPVERLVLTVPASYGPGDPRRDLMIKAGEAAGFVEVELLQEPVAAALAPMTGAAFTSGDVVLVYDFGGGTFDAAVVRFTSTADHEVLGHAALDDCGGRDLDVVIARELQESGGEALATALDGPDSAARLRATLQLGDFARGVKHQLSDSATVEDYITPAAPAFHLSRDQLVKLTERELDRTVACSTSLLNRCGVRPEQLSAIVLVGGSSRMPIVQDLVARRFGRPLRHAEDPELSVVQGGATWVERGGGRQVTAAETDPDHVPMRWAIPGGAAKVVKFTVRPGERYAAGAELIVLRTEDGALLRLYAPDRGGRLVEWHTEPGATVTKDSWLATLHPDEVVPVATPTAEPPSGQVVYTSLQKPGVRALGWIALLPLTYGVLMLVAASLALGIDDNPGFLLLLIPGAAVAYLEYRLVRTLVLRRPSHIVSLDGNGITHRHKSRRLTYPWSDLSEVSVTGGVLGVSLREDSTLRHNPDYARRLDPTLGMYKVARLSWIDTDEHIVRSGLKHYSSGRFPTR